nr:hypothetical protein [Tanacetum cinerariifolium]
HEVAGGGVAVDQSGGDTWHWRLAEAAVRCSGSKAMIGVRKHVIRGNYWPLEVQSEFNLINLSSHSRGPTESFHSVEL